MGLLDDNVNASQRIHIFSEVPSQCVLLFEDMDVAGVDMSIDALLENSQRCDVPSSMVRFLSELLKIKLSVSHGISMTPELLCYRTDAICFLIWNPKGWIRNLRDFLHGPLKCNRLSNYCEVLL